MNALKLSCGNVWIRAHFLQKSLRASWQYTKIGGKQTNFKKTDFLPNNILTNSSRPTAEELLWAYPISSGPRNNFHTLSSGLGCQYLLVNRNKSNSWRPFSLLDLSFQIRHRFNDIKKTMLDFIWKTSYLESKNMPKMKVSTSQN